MKEKYKRKYKFSKLCRNFQFWAWVWVFSLSFEFFSSWVFFAMAKLKACSNIEGEHYQSSYCSDFMIFCTNNNFFSDSTLLTPTYKELVTSKEDPQLRLWLILFWAKAVSVIMPKKISFILCLNTTYQLPGRTFVPPIPLHKRTSTLYSQVKSNTSTC